MNIQSADLRAHSIARRSPQTRMLTIGIVGALHIAAVYALVTGLFPHVIDIASGTITVIPVPEPTQPPQPQTHVKVDLIDPTAPTVKEPEVDIQRDPGPTIWQPPNKDAGSGVGDLSTPAIAIGSTHTIPPYPELAIRLRQNGLVTLRIALGADGAVGDVRIEKSSGSGLLDDAAVAWVKAHWRYRPATENGTPVVSTTLAAVRFDLKQAR
jgi:protein TonB